MMRWMSLELVWLVLCSDQNALLSESALTMAASEQGKLFLRILKCINELINKLTIQTIGKQIRIYVILRIWLSYSLALIKLRIYSNTQFHIINMTLEPKPRATSGELISFFLCGSIGLYAVTRNMIRMRRYGKTFRSVASALDKYRHNFQEIERIKSSNLKDMALLQTVFPNFLPNYFKNTQDSTKYKSSVGKFYEELECQTGFQGSLRHKGKEYPIYFQMNKPSIGFQIAQNALKFDEKGIRFHRNQMIAVYGELSYSKEAKKYIMKTSLLGLDSVQIIKFTQLRLIATIFSTLYFSILLGISLKMWLQLEILESYFKLLQELGLKIQKQSS